MSEKETALASTHQLLLDALRHREQEIFRYLAILGPALGGFIWLLHAGSAAEIRTDAAGRAVTVHELGLGVFVVGTVSVLLLLLLGAIYALALGYNYRYITLQLAKIESLLDIKNYMLNGWPRCRKDFLDRYRLCCGKPWCTPPEIIKVFWWAFIAGIGGVTLAACLYRPDALVLSVVIPVGAVALAGGFLAPLRFGKKLHDNALKEPDTWALSVSIVPSTANDEEPQ